MNQIALITGATDSIGRETAKTLAKAGYEIHGVGRSRQKSDQVLNQLRQINSQANHCFYPYDMTDIEANRNFLDQFIKEQSRLDFILLNANPLPSKKITEYGYDPLFMIGYLSRYMYSVLLNELLEKTEGSRVMHIAPVKGQSRLTRFLMSFTNLISPEMMGEIILENIKKYGEVESSGKLFNRNKELSMSKKLNDLSRFESLMQLSADLTGVKLEKKT